jgi:hypothetical protein
MDTQQEEKKKAVLRQEVQERMTGYIITALGLVAGLAWNDAISSTIKILFPVGSGSIAVKFIYAIIITIVIVVLTRSLMRVIGSKK